MFQEWKSIKEIITDACFIVYDTFKFGALGTI